PTAAAVRYCRKDKHNIRGAVVFNTFGSRRGGMAGSPGLGLNTSQPRRAEGGAGKPRRGQSENTVCFVHEQHRTAYVAVGICPVRNLNAKHAIVPEQFRHDLCSPSAGMGFTVGISSLRGTMRREFQPK